MEGTKEQYVPQEVHVLRPHFDPSEELVKALRQLLGNDAAGRVNIYGSKEVSLDPIDVRHYHYDREITQASRRLKAKSRPILFSRRIIGGKINDPTSGNELIRIAMPTASQDYFNFVVNQIDAVNLENLIPQRPGAPHYPYFEVAPHQLPSNREDRLERLEKFRLNLLSHSAFIIPDEYVGRHEVRKRKLGQIGSGVSPFPNVNERSA